MVLSSVSLYTDTERDFNNDNGNDIYNDQHDAVEIFHFCISSNKVKSTYFLQTQKFFVSSKVETVQLYKSKSHIQNN